MNSYIIHYKGCPFWRNSAFRTDISSAYSVLELPMGKGGRVFIHLLNKRSPFSGSSTCRRRNKTAYFYTPASPRGLLCLNYIFIYATCHFVSVFVYILKNINNLPKLFISQIFVGLHPLSFHFFCTKALLDYFILYIFI